MRAELILLMLGLAMAAKTYPELKEDSPWITGYQTEAKFETWMIVIMAIGFVYMVLFLLYTIGRLFVEEGMRFVQYKRELRLAIVEADKVGINSYELFHPKKKVEDDD